MIWFDTHAHLNDALFDPDRETVLDRAAQRSVSRIIEIADSPADWEAALALSRARPEQVRCSLGLHPYYADQFSDQILSQLRDRSRLPEVAAIGEIGLDYAKSSIPKEIQINAFARILEACRDDDKPAVIHCREAYPDLRTVLERLYRGASHQHHFWGVIHCFSGTTEDALYCRDLGFALGVDGPVTYPKNNSLREALRQAGLSCLVLETDSPYLPPQSNRGKRNEPAAIPEIGQSLALALGISSEELSAATTRNAIELFRIG